MIFPFGQVVTIIRSGGVDEYGDPVVDGLRIDVPRCAVSPRSSSDVAGGVAGVGERERLGVLVGLSVLFPAGTVLEQTDRFEIAGVLWQLEGVAGEWDSPFTGWRPGIEVALTRAAG